MRLVSVAMRIRLTKSLMKVEEKNKNLKLSEENEKKFKEVEADLRASLFPDHAKTLDALKGSPRASLSSQVPGAGFEDLLRAVGRDLAQGSDQLYECPVSGRTSDAIRGALDKESFDGDW